MRTYSIVAFVLVLLSAPSNAWATTYVYLKLDWENAAAFFVDAAPEAKKKMQDSISAAIESRLITCPQNWDCQPVTFRYFTGVSGIGQSQLSGYACRGDRDIPFQSYYAEYFLESSLCLRLEWQKRANRYEISMFETPNQ